MIVFDGHLVIILQVPLVDKLPIMNLYKVYNCPILHPVFTEKFLIFC